MSAMERKKSQKRYGNNFSISFKMYVLRNDFFLEMPAMPSRDVACIRLIFINLTRSKCTLKGGYELGFLFLQLHF